MLSKDTVFQNAGDLPAGGTIIGQSPLGMLPPGGAKSGSFRATVHGTPADHPYLILKADWGNVVAESNEDNNLAVVGITH
jgi:subtilase family serine protease